jgi:hypothetical protein
MGAQIRTMLHWLKIGDIPIKTFLKSLTSNKVMEIIKTLKIKNGRTIDHVSIEMDFLNHYKLVFQYQCMTKETKVEIHTYIDVVPRKLMQE